MRIKTVAELIEHLRRMPADAPVFVTDHTGPIEEGLCQQVARVSPDWDIPQEGVTGAVLIEIDTT